MAILGHLRQIISNNIRGCKIMIGRLSGKILTKNPPQILLDVGGVGYEIMCPMSSFYNIGDGDLMLHTHLHIKDDAHTLYGFATLDEKTLFRELIRVNGIGPKVALAILSNLDIASLILAITNENDVLIAQTPGIGKKTAQKLIVELKDRLAKLDLKDHHPQPSTLKNPNYNQATNALQTLGFKAKEAQKMLSEINDPTLSTEDIIRIALQNK